ncbi:MAG TPA: 50S ribosomal protein L29, partial [bacterium]|nr:50S ribosomal protein L29 [bacterium]
KRDEKKSLREATVSELEEKIQAARADLFRLRQQLRLGQLKQVSLIREKRKEIAFYMTLIQEKRLAGGQHGPVARKA